MGEPLKLAWDPSPDPDVTAYTVHYAELGNGPLQRVEVGLSTQWELSQIEQGKTYEIFVTALNGFGLESVPSNVLLHVANSSAAGVSLVNGSFEKGSSGWMVSGNQRIIAGISTDGFRSVQFNAGQRPSGGTLSQTIATQPGQAYYLSFDLGAYSTVTHFEQRLELSVSLGADTWTEVRAIYAPGNGMRWLPQATLFFAAGTTTTITFRDISDNSEDVDMWLDNVRIIEIN